METAVVLKTALGGPIGNANAKGLARAIEDMVAYLADHAPVEAEVIEAEDYYEG